MSGDAEITFRWAWALLDGLAAAGVRRVVLSPGARSTPLSLAALRHPGLATHVVVDERSAGFFALGLAKADGWPVALIATSGSAIANWFPAVAEANMARQPLILLSADRPPELHDCGANQTMDQIGLFGRHARAFHQLPPAETETGWLAALAARAVATSRGPLPGPVHLNIPLREPLVPAEAAMPAPGRPQRREELPSCRLPAAETVATLDRLLAAGTGAIVCGTDDLGAEFHRAVVDLAERLRVPLFADILSGVRTTGSGETTILAHPDRVARTAPPADWVLRFAGWPVSRAMADWLGRGGGNPQVVVADHPRPADPGGTASHVVQADAASLCRMLTAGPAAPGWLETILELDRAADRAAAELCGGDHPFEGTLLRRLMRSLPPGTPLFLGNSLTVRTAEWFCGRSPAPLRLFGNRGVSGIDGNLSTAFGLAAALGAAVAVVGDLALLHDLNALALGGVNRLVMVVLDNGGGGIFDHLPQAALPEYEEGWLTPQRLSPTAAAQAFGLHHVRAEGVGQAVNAVLSALERPGATLIHLAVDRAASLATCARFHSVHPHGAPPS